MQAAGMRGRKEREKGKRDSRRRSRQAVRKKRKRAVGEKRWTRQMESDVGNRVSGIEKRFSGFRVQVFRRLSSSTTEKSFEKF